MVLQTKYGLSEYHFVFIRPWLEKIDTYIGYKLWDMPISHGNSHNKLTLYHPARPFPRAKETLRVHQEDNN